MENTKINKRINQALEEFQSIGEVQPSLAWTESVMREISGTKRVTKIKSSSTVLVVFMGLILSGNLIFGIKMLTGEEGNKLEAISRDFLINPITAKE